VIFLVHPKILFIGHIAIDTVFKLGKKTKPSLGGSVSYCSLSLRKYDKNVQIGIISNFNESLYHNSVLKPLKKKNINLEGIKLVNKEPTKFVLKYINHSRKLKLKSKCPDLRFNDIPKTVLDKSPDAFCFVPICNEISYEFVSNIEKRYKDIYYGIDLQGFIRKINKRGRIKLKRDNTLLQRLFKIIDLLGERLILKGSENEMKLVSDKEDWNEIMNFFKKYNSISIMTLGESGSLISRKGEDTIRIPAYQPDQIVDETGAGDVYLAIFLYEFLNSDKTWTAVRDAAHLASSAASYDVEKKGVNGFQLKEKVKERIKKGNIINN